MSYWAGNVPMLRPCGAQLGPELLPNGSSFWPSCAMLDLKLGPIGAKWAQVGLKLGLVGQSWAHVAGGVGSKQWIWTILRRYEKHANYHSRGTSFWRPVPGEHDPPSWSCITEWLVHSMTLAARLSRLGTFGAGRFSMWDCCLYTYIYIYIHCYIYIFAFICKYLPLFTHVYTFLIFFTYINTYLHIFTYVYVCLHICTYDYIYLQICTYIYIFIHGSILDLGICPRNSEQSKNGLGLVMRTDWLQRGPFDLVWSEIPVLDLVGTPVFSQKRFLCDVHPTNHCWIDAVHITMRFFSGCKCKSKKDDEGLFVRWGFLASNSTDPGRSSNIGPICCRGSCSAGLMIGNPWKSYIGDVPSIFNEIEGSPVLFLFQSLTPPGALDFATWQSDRTWQNVRWNIQECSKVFLRHMISTFGGTLVLVTLVYNSY